MAEEPDDEEGREPSDSSAPGSDEERTESDTDRTESDADRERTGSDDRAANDDGADEETTASAADGEATETDDGETTEEEEETTTDDETTEEETTEGEETTADEGATSTDDGERSAADEGSAGEASTGTDADDPEFTNVQGLGPGTDPADVESAEDGAGGAGESPDDDEIFEDYDPDEPPASPADRGATAPHAEEIAPNGAERTTGGDDVDEGLLGGGPDSDEEMPLAAHIEEMMKRLSVVFVVGGAVALTLLGLGQLSPQVPTAVDIIDALWNNAIPGAPEIEGRRPRVYGPLELVLTKLKVTALAGLLVALPVFVYETYLFMRPGLYPTERRYYLSAIPTSLVLGVIGMAFSHFVIIPAIMRYFTIYTEENVATVAYGLESTFSLIIVLMGYMAVIFQIPLFIMLAIMMGIVTREWLEDKRLLFWGGFLTVAFLVNPDPTGMTPFIIAATMIVLYEGTLALLRWTGN